MIRLLLEDVSSFGNNINEQRYAMWQILFRGLFAVPVQPGSLKVFGYDILADRDNLGKVTISNRPNRLYLDEYTIFVEYILNNSAESKKEQSVAN